MPPSTKGSERERRAKRRKGRGGDRKREHAHSQGPLRLTGFLLLLVLLAIYFDGYYLLLSAGLLTMLSPFPLAVQVVVSSRRPGCEARRGRGGCSLSWNLWSWSRVC